MTAATSPQRCRCAECARLDQAVPRGGIQLALFTPPLQRRLARARRGATSQADT